MDGWLQGLWADFEKFLGRVADYLPNIVGAILILAAAWLLARLIRLIASRALRALNGLLEALPERSLLAQLQLPLWAIRLVSGLIYWIIILIGLDAATRVLDMPLATRWLDNLLDHVPTAIAVVVIIVVGVLASVLLRDVVTTGARGAGVSQARQLGIAVQAVALAIAATLGLDELGIDVDLLIAIIAVVLAAGAGGLALAFGLGARSYVANVLAARHVARLYRTGETIRIDGMQGIVSAIGPTFVTIGTEEGVLAVPAKNFLESASLSVATGDGD